MNRYSYVRNNPLFYIDPDGKDLDKAKADAKAALSQVNVKVDIGFGVTPNGAGKVKLGPGEARAEAAVKVNVKFNAGKLSGSESVEGGVSVGVKKVGELGLAGSVEKVSGSVNVDTGKLSGPEPATHEGVAGVKRGNSGTDASKDSYSIGGEAGEVLVGGGEVSITKEGLNDAKDAVVITRSETDGSQLSFDIDEGSVFGIVRAYLLPALVLAFSVFWFRKRRTLLREDSAPETQQR